MSRKLRALPYVILLLPLDLIVAVALTIATVAGMVRRMVGAGFMPAGVKPAPTVPLSSTIIIVNWDGKHLLEECLPAVLKAVEVAGGKHEVLVVDNGSTDGSAEFVRSRFPQVRVLALDRNYGFTGGNNRGVRETKTDLVIFLNNDMVVERDFLRPLLEGFRDASVFAVTSQIFFPDAAKRREETGKTRGRFERGFFYLWHDAIDSADERRNVIPVFWAGGGSCAIDRQKYLEIGGLDELYRPFYVEDTDLSYQAWKRGWKCLLAPASRVVHKHRGTSRPKFGNQFVDNTIRKNQYLFIWKNVTDLSLIAGHLLNLPRIHGRNFLTEQPGFELRAYARAVRQLPEAVWKRLANISRYAVSDREVLARSHQ